MGDLYVAMGVMTALSIAAFALMRWASSRLSPSAALLALLAAIAAVAFYVRHGTDRIEAVRWLPFSAAIIYANLTPVLAAVCAGIVWNAVCPGQQPPNNGLTWLRRLVLIVPLWAMAAFQAWHIAWAQPPPLGHHKDRFVWRQTTRASCSAAAAATLLEWHRIGTSEAEMASLCRTTRQGTRTLGVYRGLRLKAGDAYVVETYTGPVSGLRDFATSPVLVNVGLDVEDADAADPRFTSDWGWQPGSRHTVVIFAILPNNRLLVGDPSVGLEFWTLDALETLWQYEAFKLTPR